MLITFARCSKDGHIQNGNVPLWKVADVCTTKRREEERRGEERREEKRREEKANVIKVPSFGAFRVASGEWRLHCPQRSAGLLASLQCWYHPSPGSHYLISPPSSSSSLFSSLPFPSLFLLTSAQDSLHLQLKSRWVPQTLSQATNGQRMNNT